MDAIRSFSDHPNSAILQRLLFFSLNPSREDILSSGDASSAQDLYQSIGTLTSRIERALKKDVVAPERVLPWPAGAQHFEGLKTVPTVAYHDLVSKVDSLLERNKVPSPRNLAAMTPSWREPGTKTLKAEGKKYFSLIYNQHQPFYKNDTADRFEQPWVRLHATKDYYDMVAVLEKYPDVHVAISLSYSLMKQLNEYLDKLYDYADIASSRRGDPAYYPWGRLDPHLDLLMKPVEEWTEEDKAFARENFFSAHYRGQIGCFEGYRYLYDKKAAGKQFTNQDYRDLKMWFNLAWMDHFFQAGEVELIGDRANGSPLPFTKKPVESWSAEELSTAPQQFFDVTFRHQLADNKIYMDLYEKYRSGDDLSVKDLQKLADIFNTAFSGGRMNPPEKVTLVKDLMRKGVDAGYKNSGFTEDECRLLILEQYKIMKYVIPAHRRMEHRKCSDGQSQVEVVTAAHIIAPLVYDTDSATESNPGMPLPSPPFRAPEDLKAQIKKAASYYQKEFGHRPTTMWPGEAAVSENVIPFFREAGVKVILSGKEVAEKSGHYGDSTLMYRIDEDSTYIDHDGPGGTTDNSDAMSIAFRTPNDMIGFDLGANIGKPDGRDAAWKVIDMVKSIHHWNGVPKDEDMIIVNPLDGDNCWQNYTNDGADFLAALYGALENPATGLSTTTPEAFLAEHPVDRQWELEPLATGSWVGGDLSTWIGEPSENEAWSRLKATRDTLIQAGVPKPEPDSPPPDPTINRKAYFEYMAWQALYASEISCWFWWYGQDQSSGNDAYFSEAHRTHMANAYAFARQAGYNLPYPVRQISPLDESKKTVEVPPISADPRADRTHAPADGKTPVTFSVKAFTDPENPAKVSEAFIDLSPIGGSPSTPMAKDKKGNYVTTAVVKPGTPAGKKKLVIHIKTNRGSQNMDFVGLRVDR